MQSLRRTRELKRELEVPDEAASDVFFKYHDVSRARSGELLGAAIDESLSAELEPIESNAPASVEKLRESTVPPVESRTSRAPADPMDSKSTDPVRIYLRRIGSVALLTRLARSTSPSRVSRATLPMR